MTRTITMIAVFLLMCVCAFGQTPSGLLTGPVAYTSTLTSGNPYGNNTIWTKADGTQCSASSTTSPCYIIKYVVGLPFGNLQASDGTSNGISNCYTWNVSQLILNDVGYCQTSFHGGAPGEQRVGLYCGNAMSSDINGNYSLSCTAGWDGTAITVIGGVDVPIPTLYAVNVIIQHHLVSVWVNQYRRPRHLETWQQIDSVVITVTPQGLPAAQPNIIGGPCDWIVEPK
jgi:hypothetical protein